MNLRQIWWKLFQPRPFNQGFLPEKDGHRVFFMEFGNCRGKPVICFHGGPGGGLNVKFTIPFNLKKYRVILFDQRGCGRSEPLGELKNNTTVDLLEDARRLLDYLNINDRVLVRGASWGSTLAFLFAERWPEKTEAVLASQVYLADSIGEDWNMNTSHLFYPDMWEKVLKGAGDSRDVMEYYTGLINSDDVLKQVKAANLAGSYERVLGAVNPRLGYAELTPEMLAEIRLSLNYIHHKYFIRENQIMEDAGKIRHLPVLMVHNRLDMVCPLLSAYNLHKALPKSKLVIAPGWGHFGPQINQVVISETRKFLEELYGK